MRRGKGNIALICKEDVREDASSSRHPTSAAATCTFTLLSHRPLTIVADNVGPLSTEHKMLLQFLTAGRYNIHTDPPPSLAGASPAGGGGGKFAVQLAPAAALPPSEPLEEWAVSPGGEQHRREPAGRKTG